TLTAVAFGFTPDTTTKYRIMDTYGSVNGAGGIVTLATAPIAGGTGYAVGDLLAISTGVGGQARVVAVSGGVVTAVSLVNGGTSGYTAATTYATTNIIGTGTGCTLSVTTITAVGSTTVFYDNTKNWTVNKWAGKRIVFTSSATTQRSEYTIVSNTANSITTAVGLAPDITSTYTILSVSTRSTGISLKWIYGNTEIANRGNNIISLRGGNTNTIDRYNIVTDSWNQSMFFSPQSEIFTTGTMTCYDGVNTVYIHKDATGRILALDVNTLTVDGSLQLTDLHSTATIGNTMELIKTTDGLTFLYIMQHTGTKMWRALIF
ncbi:MAG: hypothetical protein NTU81_02625, partial [Candidatus Nomurabacteria bacterium]|nr:hypothetical protein [Candidatus Nomurabacteria bacterium]